MTKTIENADPSKFKNVRYWLNKSFPLAFDEDLGKITKEHLEVLIKETEEFDERVSNSVSKIKKGLTESEIIRMTTSTVDLWAGLWKWHPERMKQLYPEDVINDNPKANL